MNGVEDIDPYLLSVLFSRETGLPVTVWVRTRGQFVEPARLLVATSPGDRSEMYDAARVALSPAIAIIDGRLAPEVISAVERWAALNEGVLLDHWKGKADSADLVRSLISLPAHPRESGDPVLR